MKKKFVLFAVLLILVILGILFFIYKPTQSNNKEKTSSGKQLEAFEKKPDNKWEFTLRDYSGKLSSDEQKKKQEECLKVIDNYNKHAFNYNDKKKDDTKKLKKLSIEEESNKKYISDIPKIYRDFKSSNANVSYKNYTPYCVTIKNDEIPAVVICGVATISYGDDNLEQQDVDVTTTYILKYIDNEWKMYSVLWSQLYKSGTITAYNEDDGNSIVYYGTHLGHFSFSN